MITTEHGAANIAYRELKRRIIEAVFKPGDKLSEAKLVGDLGVGRSPLRTAIARLRSEGWISVSPQSGTYVRGLSPQEIAEIIEMRLVLETHMAGIAAMAMAGPVLAELRRSFETFGVSVEERNTEEYLDLDLKLHMAIYRAAGNELIARTLIGLLDKILWIRGLSEGNTIRLDQSLLETRDVLDALARRDPETARRAMRAHILGIRDFRSRGDERAWNTEPALAQSL